MKTRNNDDKLLNEDYITLASSYLLNPGADILPAIERIAERGQINAIQMWYYLKPENATNPNIDAILDKMNVSFYDQAMAVACREYSKNRAYFEKIEDMLNAQATKINNCCNGKNPIMLPLEQRTYNGLVEKYLDNEFGKALKNVDYIISATAKSSGKTSICEDLAEFRRATEFCLKTGVDNRVLEIRDRLKSKHKANPADSRTSFALGKNLLYFAGNSFEKAKGEKLLRSLATRELNIEKQDNNQPEV